MKRTRFLYRVSLLRDDIPGWNHQPKDAENLLRNTLPDHYEPNVSFAGKIEEVEGTIDEYYKRAEMGVLANAIGYSMFGGDGQSTLRITPEQHKLLTETSERAWDHLDMFRRGIILQNGV